MRPLLPFIYTILLCTVAVQAKWWMKQPYINDADFNARQLYLENQTLVCDDGTDKTPVDGIVEYWIRPDLEIMRPGDAESFLTLDGEAGWSFTNETGDLLIYNVQETHFGFYHCFIANATHSHVVKRAINYKGPYFGNLWPKYEMNVIIGVSVSCGFLLIVVVIFTVYKFKFEKNTQVGQDEQAENVEEDNNTIALTEVQTIAPPSKDTPEDPDDQDTGAQTEGHDNPSFQEEDKQPKTDSTTL